MQGRCFGFGEEWRKHVIWNHTKHQELYDVVYQHEASADSYISHVSQQKEQGNLTFDTVSDSSTNASSWCVFAFVFALETHLNQ